jgi:hypothetical protein
MKSGAVTVNSGFRNGAVRRGGRCDRFTDKMAHHTLKVDLKMDIIDQL